MGAAFMETVHGVARPAVGLLSIGEEAKKGTDDVVAAHAQLRRRSRWTSRGTWREARSARAVDVVVTDGFTGNVALKLMEGTAKAVGGADRRRDPARASCRRSAGCSIRAGWGGCARSSTPNTAGGAILLGMRQPVVVAHGKSSAEGIANAVRLARRAADEDMVERTAAAPRGAGPCGPRPLLASPRVMTRDEVLELIRAHLSTELGVDASRIGERTRFKEDLEADSLDLVELVMELEDRYGIRIPDEEAVKILTVGQAADFVAAHAQAQALKPGHALEPFSTSCRRIWPGRRSRIPRGPTSAASRTSGSRSWGTSS